MVPSPQVSATWINQPCETDSLPFCFPDTRGPFLSQLPHAWFPFSDSPTLAFQAWIQSFGSWLKCCFLKDALWACSTWTSCIHLFLALSRGDPRLMGILKKPALYWLPPDLTSDHILTGLCSTRSLGSNTIYLQRIFQTTPIPALPDSIMSPYFILPNTL